MLADIILLLHLTFILFIIAGEGFILLGFIRNWVWIRNIWFRTAHVLAVGVVVLESWTGIICPLTLWENMVRRAAGQNGYPGTFIGHWMGRLIYYRAPEWVFTVVYTAFGALVVLSWFLVKPLRAKPHPENS